MPITSQLALDLTEYNLVPDAVIRRGIRYMLKRRLKEIHSGDITMQAEIQTKFLAEMARSQLALVPEKANDQHYEVPAEFFRLVLGPRLKYSSALWKTDVGDLSAAEEAALAVTCEHAGLENGQDILELGCGWGSLTLWLAELYPDSNITSVSNSASQRLYIETHARDRGLHNIKVLTRDMNAFETEERFDRVVSVEMFEHMRNWEQLYHNISTWLKPSGRFFKHIFVHRNATYAFIDRGAGDWMSRYFFSGGMMPSDDLPLFFQRDLNLLCRWRWDGTHYERTANAWLENLDRHEDAILSQFEPVYGERDSNFWLQRWRIFFMSCAELFGYNGGQEWFVSHYLFEKPSI